MLSWILLHLLLASSDWAHANQYCQRLIWPHWFLDTCLYIFRYLRGVLGRLRHKKGVWNTDLY